jgi:hypothetical protein
VRSTYTGGKQTSSREERSGGRRGGDDFRRGGQDKKREPANVHLSINQRFVELAEDIAAQSDMDVQAYLERSLVLVIKAHAEKLGISTKKKLVTEFKNTSTEIRTRTSGRRPDLDRDR